MAKLKLKSKREYIRLADVANEYECDVTPEELFSEAAIGELTIYVDLDQDQAVIVWSKHLMKKMSQTDGEIIIDEDLNPPNEKNFRENVINKDTKKFYRYTLFGYQPITSRTFETNKINRDTEYIEIETGKSLDGKSILFNQLLILTHPITLQEALDDRKLYVMKSDVEEMLIEESSAPVVAKPKVSASKKTIKGRRKATDECYAEWQRRANEKIKNNPTLSKYAVAKLIYKDLSHENSSFLRSIDNIRQHIKI